MSIVMIISSFEKSEEMKRFFESLKGSDIEYIPRIVTINRDPEHGLTGQENIEIAKHFKRYSDRVFVSHKNLYMSLYRYVIQKYATEYELLIGTEADVWFERPLTFIDSLKYIQQHAEVASISCLARYQTNIQNGIQFKDITGWKKIDKYLDSPTCVPWHMYLTRMPYILNFFALGHELSDSRFAKYCQNRQQKKLLVLDCREYFVHLGYHATIRKYPEYTKFCGKQHFDIKQRAVDTTDIEEL